MAKNVVVTTTNYQHLRKVNVVTAAVTGTSLPTWASVTDDGHNTFETVVSVSPAVPGLATVIVPAGGAGGNGAPTSGVHRYWRINITVANGGVCSVGEVEFWYDAVTKHATTGGTAIASATGAGTAAEVFDGNVATFWYSGGSTGWIGYDFGSGNTKAVSLVAITGRDSSQYPTTWAVEYSDNGSSWTAVTGFGGATGQFLGRNPKKYYFTDPAAGYKHFRYRWTADSSGAVRLAALEARTSVGGADMSSTAFAKVSHDDTVGTVASLFDASAATAWAGTLFPLQVILYFPNAPAIAQVLLQGPPDNLTQGPDELYLDTSPDGIVWTNVFSTTGIAAWTAGLTRTYTI